jgi:hypothetical protein
VKNAVFWDVKTRVQPRNSYVIMARQTYVTEAIAMLRDAWVKERMNTDSGGQQSTAYPPSHTCSTHRLCGHEKGGLGGRGFVDVANAQYK